jgi:hypothetical protein
MDPRQSFDRMFIHWFTDETLSLIHRTSSMVTEPESEQGKLLC